MREAGPHFKDDFTRICMLHSRCPPTAARRLGHDAHPELRRDDQYRTLCANASRPSRESLAPTSLPAGAEGVQDAPQQLAP